jgi:prophage regulatory protein
MPCRVTIFSLKSSRNGMEAELEFQHSLECLLMPHPNASFRIEQSVNAADLLRLPAVVRQTGLSRSTIYRLMATRHFPLPVKLAGRAVGWRRSDVDRWSDSLPQVTH